jgi:XRE family transcriptional regulator, aerobic/anaerobic benzoate catabolism transcriptional regulator
MSPLARARMRAGPTAERDPLLTAIGVTVRNLRALKGVPRRTLAARAGVSERHLASLESGVGNVSVLILQQVANALSCSIAELLGDETTTGPEWLLIRDILHQRGEEDLRRARLALADLFERSEPIEQRAERIALIGLRGAGKSTLGRQLAKLLDRPFVELGAEITRIAGLTPAEIQDLYGPAAYRRYEAQALKECLAQERRCVLATPGGIVSDVGSFGLLLSHCLTVWLQAKPQEHMERVLAQGDLRPMAGNREAMEDLKAILRNRTPYYERADLTFDTSGKTLDEALDGLRVALAQRPGAR